MNGASQKIGVGEGDYVVCKRHVERLAVVPKEVLEVLHHSPGRPQVAEVPVLGGESTELLTAQQVHLSLRVTNYHRLVLSRAGAVIGGVQRAAEEGGHLVTQREFLRQMLRPHTGA